jgi:hypothetical protein
MRKMLPFLLAPAAWLATCGPAPGGLQPCPSWDVLDRFPSQDGHSVFANVSVVDGHGNYFYDVYVEPGNGPWFVRKSADHGRTWSTVDRVQLRPDRFNYPMGMTVDAEGHPWVAGVVATESDTRGMIRTTSDEGQTWTVSDYFLYPGSTDCKIYQVRRIDSALFAMGRCAVGGMTHWLVRRSLDAGRTWTTVDFPHEGRVRFSKAFDVAKANDGSLLMLGIVDSETGNGLLVRRSVDAGATWTDAWSDQTEPGADDVVGSIMVTSRGSLLMNEWVIDKKRHGRGVIRRSVDNGRTWTIADTFRHADELTLYAAIVEDAWGRLLALASTAETAFRQGFLRQSLDDGATWQDLSVIHGDHGESAGFSGMSIDAGTSLLVTGIQGASAPFGGVIMKLPLLAPGTACRAS